MAAPGPVRSALILLDTTYYTNKVTISWRPPATSGGYPIRTYRISMKIGESGEWLNVATSTLPKTGFPTTASSRNITHTLGDRTNTAYYPIYYRIIAVNTNSEVGAPVILGPVTPLSAIPAPTQAPTAVSTAKGSATVTITSPTITSSISSYIVSYRLANTTTAWTNVTNINYVNPTTTTTLNNLIPGSLYEFSTRAVNASGNSRRSPSSAPVRTLNPASTPTTINAVDRAKDLTNGTRYHGFRLRWTDTQVGRPAITSWVVRVRPSGSSTWNSWTISNADVNLIKNSNVPSLRAIDIFSLSPPSFDNQSGGLPQGLYEMQIQAVNRDGVSSFTPIYTFDTTRNLLFNKSIMDIDIFDIIPSRHKRLITEAMNIWEKYIRYNKVVFESLKSTYSDDYDWDGLTLAEWETFNNPNTSTIAAAYQYTYPYEIGGVQCAPAFYGLRYNAAKELESDAWWLRVWLHELGHALGIGSLWDKDICPGATEPTNNLLNGTVYSRTQAAYNTILQNNTRKFVPLESSGGQGTVNGHWEDVYRNAVAPSTINYPGLTNELMIGNIPPGAANPVRILSSLTIKALVDLGWEEVLPNSSEGVPSIAFAGMQMQQTDMARCGGIEIRPLPPPRPRPRS